MLGPAAAERGTRLSAGLALRLELITQRSRSTQASAPCPPAFSVATDDLSRPTSQRAEGLAQAPTTGSHDALDIRSGRSANPRPHCRCRLQTMAKSPSPCMQLTVARPVVRAPQSTARTRGAFGAGERSSQLGRHWALTQRAQVPCDVNRRAPDGVLHRSDWIKTTNRW